MAKGATSGIVGKVIQMWVYNSELLKQCGYKKQNQTIIWTNAGILLIGPLRTNFSEILIEFHLFSIQENAFEHVIWKMAATLCRPQCINQKNETMHIP